MNPTIEYIFEHGKHYKPGWPPKDMIRGKVGHCFDTCALNAIKGNYRYVEGLAEDPYSKGRFLLHSWLTDGEHAFDPTWLSVKWSCSVPVQTVYIGFEIDTKDMARFFAATEYAGIIANAWRNPKLAHKCLPGDFPIGKIASIVNVNEIHSLSPEL